jgi:DNA-binding transcriptional regulator PaaX
MITLEKKRKRFGPVMQKVLLLLRTGATLFLSGSPHMHFKIIKTASKEWQKIDQRVLRKSIRRLYQSKLVDVKEEENGALSLTLTDNGEKKILQYDLDKIKIKKPLEWDGVWRMVVFDIPESQKQGRDALVGKLKQLGFYPLQKSVFLHPYECKEEIDFIVELFDLRPFVRFMRVKEIDVELDLKHRFGLN